MQQIIMQTFRKEIQAVRVTCYASTFHGTYPLQERRVHTKSWWPKFQPCALGIRYLLIEVKLSYNLRILLFLIYDY